MGIICKQVNIPEVDNTEPTCPEYVTEHCLLFETPISYLQINTGDSIHVALTKIAEKFVSQSKVINNLRASLENTNRQYSLLEDRVRILEKS